MSPREETFRWGLVGPGRIARAFAAGVGPAEGVLRGVCGLDVGRCEDFCRRHGGERVYEDYDEMLADPSIDAAYVATPHTSHHDLSLRALEAGKPVLCEKPLTVCLADAEALVAASRRGGIFLMEALWTRFLPIYQRVRAWLEEGRIGQVRHIVASFGMPFPRDLADRVLNPQMAGGSLLDLGIYPLSVTQWLLGGDPQAMVAVAHLGETGVDEGLAVSLIYEGGITGQFTTSLTAELANEFCIYGSEGHLRIGPRFWQAQSAICVRGGEVESVEEPFEASGFEYQIREVQRRVREGALESPVVPHAQSLSLQRGMEEIRAQIGLRYPFESPP